MRKCARLLAGLLALALPLTAARAAPGAGAYPFEQRRYSSNTIYAADQLREELKEFRDALSNLAPERAVPQEEAAAVSLLVEGLLAESVPDAYPEELPQQRMENRGVYRMLAAIYGEELAQASPADIVMAYEPDDPQVLRCTFTARLFGQDTMMEAYLRRQGAGWTLLRFAAADEEYFYIRYAYRCLRKDNPDARTVRAMDEAVDAFLARPAEQQRAYLGPCSHPPLLQVDIDANE